MDREDREIMQLIEDMGAALNPLTWAVACKLLRLSRLPRAQRRRVLRAIRAALEQIAQSQDRVA